MTTATYSPQDDKLRIYPATRLDDPRLKSLGFGWAPKQECFYAVWSPAREDLASSIAGDIDDETMSTQERAEMRAERFEDYSHKRGQEASAAHKVAEGIMDGIPLGQPILRGHHSEQHARKDAQRIEDNIRKAVNLWETAQYWQSRAKASVRHAQYKERPDVRARRIKGLEADLRKQERSKGDSEKFLRVWHKITGEDAAQDMKNALLVSNFDHISMEFPLADFPRTPPASQYEGSIDIWSALDRGIITPMQARDLAIPRHERLLTHYGRWINHLQNRLAYERAMLAGDGGTVADQTAPEKGGAVRCWVGRTGEWHEILKVNKISVTVQDTWDGVRFFTRTVPCTDLKGVMSKAEVDSKRENRLLVAGTRGNPKAFFVLPDEEASTAQQSSAPEIAPALPAFDVETAKSTLRAGVQAVAVPQLFQTPVSVADRIIGIAGIQPGEHVLEPEAGHGRLVDAVLRVPLFASNCHSSILALEMHHGLAEALHAKRLPRTIVTQTDFLSYEPPVHNENKFDAVVMNPPFTKGADVEHVTHALKFLKPLTGRLVAIMSNGVTFREDKKYQEFRRLLNTYYTVIEALPDDTFKEAGTSVKTVLVTVRHPIPVPIPEPTPVPVKMIDYKCEPNGQLMLAGW